MNLTERLGQVRTNIRRVREKLNEYQTRYDSSIETAAKKYTPEKLEKRYHLSLAAEIACVVASSLETSLLLHDIRKGDVDNAMIDIIGVGVYFTGVAVTAHAKYIYLGVQEKETMNERKEQ